MPVAVEELARPAQELRKQLMKPKRDESRPEEHRDRAIGELAGVFHEHADPSLNDPAAYRKELTAFVIRALRIAKFNVPEPRKVWERIPRVCRKPR